VAGYQRLAARECVAEIAAGRAGTWFHACLPGSLLLGDPAARDAALHAIQACIPHATLLPTGLARVEPGRLDGGKLVVHAVETRRDGDRHVYDVELRDAGGRLVERWTGLTLVRFAETRPPAAWPAPLLGPLVERLVEDHGFLRRVSVAVCTTPADRRARSDAALAELVGAERRIVRRPDGRPEGVPESPLSVSATHAGPLTLAAAASGTLACDLEPVAPRPEAEWLDLLGPDGARLAELLAGALDEPLDAAATRVWCARECLKKAGAMLDTPLLAAEPLAAGCVALTAGPLRCVTWVFPVAEVGGPLALALLTEAPDAGV
jgi:enediyne polyketide synthase